MAHHPGNRLRHLTWCGAVLPGGGPSAISEKKWLPAQQGWTTTMWGWPLGGSPGSTSAPGKVRPGGPGWELIEVNSYFRPMISTTGYDSLTWSTGGRTSEGPLVTCAIVAGREDPQDNSPNNYSSRFHVIHTSGGMVYNPTSNPVIREASIPLYGKIQCDTSVDPGMFIMCYWQAANGPWWEHMGSNQEEGFMGFMNVTATLRRKTP